ncbi:PDZ domain-containing protein [Sphingomonas sp. PAMC26645]|uniref:PDZ domain-containing protein n=1 Tax=Sphingomonas sp. PAMC26645 TaxID=2565555 RepID=UPI001446630B|nr:PDZ domain-containing protein [Sphingomonas sp. PAMC26645]
MRRALLTLVPLIAVLFVSAREPSKSAPATATSPAARDRGVYHLAADAEARWIAFDLTPGNQIRFKMQLDGRDVTAILDTGVSYTLLAKASPAADPAKLVAGGSATAIGGSVALGWMPTRSVALGGLARTGGGVTVADLPAIATGSASAVDLLVGADMLAGHALDIDYAAKRFRLLRSGRLPFKGESAPLRVSAERSVYESALTLGGRRLAPIVVDTGDGSSITVTAAGWQAANLKALRTTSAIAFGLAGPAVSGLAIVPEIGVGEMIAREAEVRIEPADGFSQAIGTAGRIGSGFLQNYRVLLDPGARRMVLSRGPRADLPPPRSTSGLLIGIEKDRLKILHVMRGGPAAASGWKDGDLICAIDGTPVTSGYSTSPIASWTAGMPGRVVTLGLCDGTIRKLELTHFY